MATESTNKMINKYKKAMVAGSAGFIDSHLVEELLKLRLQVISTDNYVSGKRENP